jgi:hypothetical protein
MARKKLAPAAFRADKSGSEGGCMPGRAIDRIEALLEPHAKAISILAAIWFWLSIAIYAGFVRLPQLPWLSDRALFWAGLAFNAAWWGFLRPAMEQRRKARGAAEP